MLASLFWLHQGYKNLRLKHSVLRFPPLCRCCCVDEDKGGEEPHGKPPPPRLPPLYKSWLCSGDWLQQYREYCCVIYVCQAQPAANMIPAGVWKLLIPKAFLGYDGPDSTWQQGAAKKIPTRRQALQANSCLQFCSVFSPHSTTISRIVKFPNVYQHLFSKKNQLKIRFCHPAPCERYFQEQRNDSVKVFKINWCAISQHFRFFHAAFL